MLANETDRVADITQLLILWSDGDGDALRRLTTLVYTQLRRVAASILANERRGHTLQPTALVHELYLNLQTARGINWKCRGQFFAICAKVMRRILLDHARKRIAAKRNGVLLPLEEVRIAAVGPDLARVDSALSRLSKHHPRQAMVVELRFFGGLTAEETIEALQAIGEDVSLRTVERDWRFSRAWLEHELGPI
jgi:RNA polymerase sigma-70 factor (ECF subfamily)